MSLGTSWGGLHQPASVSATMLGAARGSLKHLEQTPPHTASDRPVTCGWAEQTSTQRGRFLWCRHSSAPALFQQTIQIKTDKLNTKSPHTTVQHWKWQPAHWTSRPPALSIDNPPNEALTLLSQKTLVHTLTNASPAHHAVLPLSLSQQHQLHGVLTQRHLHRRKQHENFKRDKIHICVFWCVPAELN